MNALQRPPIGRLAREELNRRRLVGKRTALLNRCRQLMATGNFRPTAADITRAPHDIVNLFGNMPRLYEQALDDDTTARIAEKIHRSGRAFVDRLARGDLHRIARAAVFGRLST